MVLLGTAVLVAGSAIAVAAQQSGQEHARSVATQLPAPPSAEASDSCNGDAIVACWETSANVTDTALVLEDSLEGAARTTPRRTCDRVPVGTSGPPMQADACFVRVRFGSHGVFVFVDPVTKRDAAGVATVVGSRVSVSAA